MSFEQVNPIKVYEVNGVPCKIKAVTSAGIVGTNRTVVSAITGKIIRFMGFAVCPTLTNVALGNIPTISFKDGSGGRAFVLFGVPNGLDGSKGLPVIDSGYDETTVSTGLFADIGIADCYYTVFYIEYTPET